MTITSAAIVAPLIAAIACLTDLHSRRIPNALTLGGALTALIAQAISNGAAGATAAAAGWLVGIAVFFLPFALGGMGAGDVKLLAALGAWFGPADTIWLALYAGIAGGVLAVAVGLAHGYMRQALVNVWRLLAYWRAAGLRPLDEMTLADNRGPRLAYAVPILIGTLVTVWLH